MYGIIKGTVSVLCLVSMLCHFCGKARAGMPGLAQSIGKSSCFAGLPVLFQAYCLGGPPTL